MKKTKKFLAELLACFCALSFTACEMGQDGQDGQNGVTPHIGTNGNWWIGETDTGVSAQGAQGPQGPQGEQGERGEQGADGLTPHIGTNGNWWIGDTDTGVSAQGPQGEQGEQGERGEQGEQGEQGRPGENGVGISSMYIENGHLYAVLTNGTTIDCGEVPTTGGCDCNNPTTPTDCSCDTRTYSQGLEYALEGNEYAVASIGTCADADIVIPATYEGLPVTSIRSTAFLQKEIKSISIPHTIKNIGLMAMAGCIRLENINVCANNANFTSLDGNLYSKNEGVLIQYAIGKTQESFSIPATVNSIEYAAFAFCVNLKNVIIPDSVTAIGLGVFAECNSLTSVNLPDSVTSIGQGAFPDCDNLQYNIKDGIKYLGNPNNPYVYLADVETTDITSANIQNGCKFIGSNAFWNCDNLTSVTIPNGVVSIGYMAFDGCSNLTSVTIPNTVISIGETAFGDCKKLTSVNIPASVRSIATYAFGYCDSLTNISVDENNMNYKSIDGNLYSKNGTKLIQYAIGKTATRFVIPSGVTSIGREAFDSCRSLTNITIPNSMTYIDYAFACCYNLTTLKFNGTVAEWNAIRKDNAWTAGFPATEVICSDGNVTIRVADDNDDSDDNWNSNY